MPRPRRCRHPGEHRASRRLALSARSSGARGRAGSARRTGTANRMPAPTTADERTGQPLTGLTSRGRQVQQRRASVRRPFGGGAGRSAGQRRGKNAQQREAQRSQPDEQRGPADTVRPRSRGGLLHTPGSDCARRRHCDDDDEGADDGKFAMPALAGITVTINGTSSATANANQNTSRRFIPLILRPQLACLFPIIYEIRNRGIAASPFARLHTIRAGWGFGTQSGPRRWYGPVIDQGPAAAIAESPPYSAGALREGRGLTLRDAGERRGVQARCHQRQRDHCVVMPGRRRAIRCGYARVQP